MERKNVSGQHSTITLLKRDGTDYDTGTPTVTIITGTSDASAAGTLTHVTGAFWDYAWDQDETNYDQVALCVADDANDLASTRVEYHPKAYDTSSGFLNTNTQAVNSTVLNEGDGINTPIGAH